jgi:hypothetical protein
MYRPPSRRAVPPTGDDAEGNRLRPKENTTGMLVVEASRRPGPPDRDVGQSRPHRADRRDTVVTAAGLDGLFTRAQKIDLKHRIQHSRPVGVRRSPTRREVGASLLTARSPEA